MIGSLTEKIKSISTATALIPNLQSEIKNMATQISSLKEDLGSKVIALSGRVLVNEENIAALETTISNNSSYLDLHVKPAVKKLEKGGLIDSISPALIKKISANEAAIMELKTQLTDSVMDKTLHYGLSESEMENIALHVHEIETTHPSTNKHNNEERFGKLDDEIQKLRDIINNRLQNNNYNNNNKNKNNTNQSSQQQGRGFVSKFTPDENETLDYDTIIIGDSNTKKIDMSSLGRGPRKRYTCYTIPHVTNFLNTATIKRQPKKVMVHIGTNDVEGNLNETELRRCFADLIALLRKTFPTARIFFSSIFVRMRKDDPLNSKISSLNSQLEEFCDKTPLFTLMDNSDISHEDMADKKHLNPSGLHAFICNIWKVIFGERYKPQRRRKSR